MLISKPIDHLLRGFSFEASGFDASGFFLEAFVLPLYVPQKHLSFTFGSRIGSFWVIDNLTADHIMTNVLDCVMSKGLPLLDRSSTIRDFAQWADNLPHAADPHVQEAISFSFVLCREWHVANSKLERHMMKLTEHIDDHPESNWIRDMFLRAERIHEALRVDPNSALHLLAEWEASSRRNLRLT